MKLNQLYLATGVLVTMAAPAFAASSNGNISGSSGGNAAGDKLLGVLNTVLTGNLMLAIGLIIAVIGLWVWLVKQEAMAGILMIVGGVLLTAAPAIFNGASTVVTPVVDELGSKGNFSKSTVSE